MVAAMAEYPRLRTFRFARAVNRPREESKPVNPEFARFENSDVRRLIAQHPLAWLISPNASATTATPLPLVGAYDENDVLSSLIGHMARSNPLHRVLVANPEAVFLFNGPQAYVSPEHSGRRNWAPTWNYAVLRVEAQVTMDIDMTEDALEVLIDHVEKGRTQPWRREELGGRYTNMLQAIVGFEARVENIHGTFKLGQDEDAATFRTIVDTHPDSELQAWMRIFGHRLSPARD
jgi:transcriptional regulator